MEGIKEYILDNLLFIIIISIPTFYFIIRDIFVLIQKKSSYKQRLQEIAASERRLEELYKKINLNKMHWRLCFTKFPDAKETQRNPTNPQTQETQDTQQT